MAKNDYTYRLLSAQDRKQTAESMLRDVERQIFSTKDQLQSAQERDDNTAQQHEQQLQALIARADRLAGLIEEAEKDLSGGSEKAAKE